MLADNCVLIYKCSMKVESMKSISLSPLKAVCGAGSWLQAAAGCSWLCWQSVRSWRVRRLGPGVNGIQSLFPSCVPLVSLHHHHHTVIPSAARIQQTITAHPPAFLSHNLILARSTALFVICFQHWFIFQSICNANIASPNSFKWV